MAPGTARDPTAPFSRSLPGAGSGRSADVDPWVAFWFDQPVDAIEIPVIDIGGFASSGARQRAIAREVAAALEEIGFFSFIGHGIPTDLTEEVLAKFWDFFGLPQAAKVKYESPSGDLNRGYTRFGAEFQAGAKGVDTPPDLREGFAFGRFDLPDDSYFQTADAGFAYAPNVWPDDIAGLTQTFKRYYAAIEKLNLELLRIFAIALDLDESFFLDKFDKHASIVRALNYPDLTQAAAPDQLRCGAHTDFGSHTILLFNDAPGGLQVMTRGDRWIDVRPPHGGFVVNIGDLMMRWTNDRWLSNLHRVVNPPADARTGTRRQSIAYFVHPNYDALIECLASCQRPSEPARHPAIRAGDHRRLQLEKTAK